MVTLFKYLVWLVVSMLGLMLATITISMFLVESAGIASDHVDRDADAVEHMLPKQFVQELEHRLAADGRLPVVPQAVPQSPHDL